MANKQILEIPNRVVTPFIKVTFGDANKGYTFGVFDKSTNQTTINEISKSSKINYPNYIQSLSITKINGQVNQYTLNINYAITENNDPNFFEKIFSSISKSRNIIFSYGDLSAPNFCYRNENAIITKISTSFNTQNAVISYVVYATSNGVLSKVGNFYFPATTSKPSDIIKQLLKNSNYGLKEIFPGMKNDSVIQRLNLIPGDDKKVRIEAKANISILDYLTYLVNCMTPMSTSKDTLLKSSLYALTIVDDTTGEYGNSFDGTYFKIIRLDQALTNPEAYELNFGYPSGQIVTQFNIEDQETYSLLYDYQEKISTTNYVDRIDDSGKPVSTYAPVISSRTALFKTTEKEKDWWTKVTQYPVKASITVKGLLRPVILTTYVRLNVLYYGKKHISSGIYMITKQEDKVDGSGFTTTLNMVRVGTVSQDVI